MAYITSNNSNSIDRNANSANRQRRNWQRARQGALTNTIRTAAPLTSSSTIGLAFFTSTGLGLVSNSLALLFADASITGSASGIKVAEQASGGLSTGVGGMAVDNTVVRTTRLISTTTPLAGGGDLSADRTLSIPQATSTVNGYLSSTDWTTFNNKQAAGSFMAGSTLLGTTAPLTGGGTISTGLTLSMPQANSTANGWLSSTDWTTFNNKGSGGGGTVAAADTSIIFPTSSTFQVQPYRGLSTVAGGVELYGDQATAFGPQVAAQFIISTATLGSRAGLAIQLGSTSSTQANNAIIADLNLRNSGAGSIKLWQGSTLLLSSTSLTFTVSTTHTVMLVLSGTQASILVDGVVRLTSAVTINDDTGVGFFIDSSAERDPIKSWGASTGLATIVQDTFSSTTYTDFTGITSNANYAVFGNGNEANPAAMFNDTAHTTDLTVVHTSTLPLGVLMNASAEGQGIVWKPSRNTSSTPNKYQWGVALAPNSGLSTGPTGLAVALNTNGGLLIPSPSTGGLQVNGFAWASSDPTAPTLGQSWFNSTSGVNKTNLALVSGNTLPAQLVGTFWIVASGAQVSSTTAKTNLASGVLIPAGFFNQLGRTARILMILGGNLTSGSTTLTLNWGTVVIWSQVFSTNPASMWVEMILQTTATGASGFQQTLGRVSSFNHTMSFNTGGATQDLTSATTLQWAVQFTAASSTNNMNIAYLTGELLV